MFQKILISLKLQKLTKLFIAFTSLQKIRIYLCYDLRSEVLVQHGINKDTISKSSKSRNQSLWTFDERPAVLAPIIDRKNIWAIISRIIGFMHCYSDDVTTKTTSQHS
ncbi:hypothetical protein BMF81_00128 [Nodularia spumigena UHCC 0039]|uniref:Uncharacterized protein n=1 Tax=Nodularia spumigena UHCC 0039 TaxID=1914872 RepID=A0A2S0Q519_NODSP|nr:hypothetical protein BMF81_00128 [Nodularia spumigena UHCC 0039]